MPRATPDITVLEVDDVLTICRSLRNLDTVLLLLMTVGFLAVGIIQFVALSNFTYFEVEDFLTPAVLVLVGSGAGYFGLVGLINRVEIRVECDSIYVMNIPLPSFSPRCKQYEKPIRIFHKRFSYRGYRGRLVMRYLIRFQFEDGRVETIDRVEDEETARTICNAIRDFLK